MGETGVTIPLDLKAAVVLRSGLMYLGATHGEALCEAMEDSPEMDWEGVCEGFFCDAWGFLFRDETEAMWGDGESRRLAEARGDEGHKSHSHETTSLGGDWESEVRARSGWSAQPWDYHRCAKENASDYRAA
jgi:hypothetical protein